MEAHLQADLRAQLIDRRQRLTSAADRSKETLQITELLRQVDSALERMDRGTYGICQECHETIETDRLLSDPLLCFCLDHLDERQRIALQEDLDLASRVQSGLLPQREFRSRHWEACYYYKPVGAVSGDYCELMTPEDGAGRLFFAVGDVSGKGVAASLLMAHLHAILRSLLSADLSLKEIVERANRIFCASALPSAFATLVCGWAGDAGEIEICNAGHCAPLVLPDGGAAVEATGLPLGLFTSGHYEVRRLTLAPDQGLLLYTDGLTEARDALDEEFGLGRLSTFLRDHAHLAAPDLISACRRQLSDYTKGARRADDVTAMVIRRPPMYHN